MPKSLPLVESLIDELLAAPGYRDLPQADKEKTAEKLRVHVEQMIIETCINRLSDGQEKEIKNYLNDPDTLEAKIEEFAATIPGLSDDIESRLKREFEMLKALA